MLENIKIILITGIDGFIGNNLINHLPKNKKYLFVTRKKLKRIKNLKYENIITKNIFKEKKDWWLKNLKNVEMVIHLAWTIKNKNYKNSRKNIECYNGSKNLFDACIKKNIKKFIGIGSIAEIENDKSLYSKYKKKTFEYFIKESKKNKIFLKWVRIGYVYGRDEQKFKLTSQIMNHKKKSKIILKSPQKKHFFIHIKKVSKKLIQIIFKNFSSRIIFEIQGKNKITVERFHRLLTEKKIEY